MDDAKPRIPIIGLSDPITYPTGFGRVARELFSRLSESPEFDCAYLARDWVGTRRWPNLKTYVGSDEWCQRALGVSAMDFCPDGPLVLWTLSDPWQMGWIGEPIDNANTTPESAAFLKAHRKRIRWVGHFPIDGWGPREGPALWTEDFLNAPDFTVFMAPFGERVMKPFMKAPHRTILHAVDTDVYRPLDKGQAKAAVESLYAQTLAKMAARAKRRAGDDDTEDMEEAVAAEVEGRRLELSGKFVVGVVMANRERKYWPQVLEAFAGLLEKVPESRLVGICGDRTGEKGGWPLIDYARMLGLERKGGKPITWLFDHFGKAPWEEDSYMALFQSAFDATVVLSGGEGFGLPQLEAHACGTPCFVGDYSASPDFAADPRELIPPRGYYYVGTNMVRRPVYSARDLTDKLVYAARNPGWRQECGLRGAEIARRDHSWGVVFPQWVELFKEVVGGGG